jgi:ubiquinone/menaquinone biosynthesis C-methylase UbiE
MSIGRRQVRLDDESAWIFNRMVEAYEARPAYPLALVDALAELAAASHAAIADIGAGLGHLALPLAERNFKVTALEPATAMLQRLNELTTERALPLTTVHGMAEAMPFAVRSFDLVIVSDAVHFLDSERAAQEVARVLAPKGAVALVTCEFTPTPFMQAVVQVMEQAAPRRPREVSSALTELLAVSNVRDVKVQTFSDETPVDRETLERILCSISFIGPAMNAERYAAFRERIHAIPHPAVWARTFTLRAGRRAGRA